MVEEIETKSRNVFGGHHIVQQSDEEVYNQKISRFENYHKYLGLPEGWFKGKKVLDACCGTALSCTHSFLNMGAEVTAIDLPGEHEFNESRIKDNFAGKYKLIRGSVLELPFEDNQFDYIHCEGSLHHTTNPKKGFMELARVCKPDGYVYITQFGTPGLFREAEDYFRIKYKKNEQFRNLIDNLTTEQLQEYVKWINSNLKEINSYMPKPIPVELFNQDLVLTIKDRLQAPIYTRHSEQEIMDWYKEAGFDAKRITRYPKGIKGLREYMCPIYEHYNHPLSKLINGDGFMQFIGMKK